MLEHPDITRTLRSGYPYDVKEAPKCPVCGEEADEFYKNEYGDIVGCTECICKVDAYEEMEEEYL